MTKSTPTPKHRIPNKYQGINRKLSPNNLNRYPEVKLQLSFKHSLKDNSGRSAITKKVMESAKPTIIPGMINNTNPTITNKL